MYDIADSDANLVLKGVIRPEKIQDPSAYIQALLDRVDKDHISRIYGVDQWEDAEEFLTMICNNSGRLLKGGDPDLETMAKMILHDW